MYSLALAALSPDDSSEVSARMDSWQNGICDKWRQIVANISAETALPLADFVSLLAGFANAVRSSPGDPAGCWIEACRAHQFRGALFDKNPPLRIGHAAPLSKYFKLVSDTSGDSLSPDQCEELVREVTMAGATPKARSERILRRALISRWVIWATFSQAHPAECPFEHLPRTTEAIRTALGLGECPETESLVLISYTTGNPGPVIQLYRPTVAEAGSYCWYRPFGDAAAAFGYTGPLPPNALGLSPQPEIVHREITGATLCFPVYLAV